VTITEFVKSSPWKGRPSLSLHLAYAAWSFPSRYAARSNGFLNPENQLSCGSNHRVYCLLDIHRCYALSAHTNAAKKNTKSPWWHDRPRIGATFFCCGLLLLTYLELTGGGVTIADYWEDGCLSDAARGASSRSAFIGCAAGLPRAMRFCCGWWVVGREVTPTRNPARATAQSRSISENCMLELLGCPDRRAEFQTKQRSARDSGIDARDTASQSFRRSFFFDRPSCPPPPALSAALCNLADKPALLPNGPRRPKSPGN